MSQTDKLVQIYPEFLGLPSLKTVLGIYFIENEAALSSTGSNPLPLSVKLYSTLTGYSETILLLIIPSRSSSRRRSVRTLGDTPPIFSIKRLKLCVTSENFHYGQNSPPFSNNFKGCFNRA